MNYQLQQISSLNRELSETHGFFDLLKEYDKYMKEEVEKIKGLVVPITQFEERIPYTCLAEIDKDHGSYAVVVGTYKGLGIVSLVNQNHNWWTGITADEAYLDNGLGTLLSDSSHSLPILLKKMVKHAKTMKFNPLSVDQVDVNGKRFKEVFVNNVVF